MADSLSSVPSDDSRDEDSACDALLDQDAEADTYYLHHYDPFHGVTVAISAPGPDEHELGPCLAPLGVSALHGADAPRTLRAVAQASAQPCPGIDYQDFAPDIEGLESGEPRCAQRFRELTLRANSWLQQNPHMRVRTCETVTWCTHQLRSVGDTESVIMHRWSEADQSDENYVVVGLRLWVKVAEDNSPPQVLHCRDFRSQPAQTLNDLVAAANSAIKGDKTTGDALSAETLLVPDTPSWDTERVVWRESQCPASDRHALCLRVFYTRCSRRLPVVGVKNIVPEVVNGYYESYSKLMQRASEWITTQSSIQLLNLKSVHVNKADLESAAQSTDQCRHHWRQYQREQYIQVLRIFYAHSPSTSAHALRHPPLSCMTFTPVQTTLGDSIHVQFEKLKQTMIRITAWLELADAEIRCMETLITPFVCNSPNHTLPEVMYWTPGLVPPAKSQPISPFLFHFRVYLQGEYIEPDLSLLPPLPYSLATAHAYPCPLAHPLADTRTRQKRKFRFKVYVVVANVVILAVGLVVFSLFYFNRS